MYYFILNIEEKFILGILFQIYWYKFISMQICILVYKQSSS